MRLALNPTKARVEQDIPETAESLSAKLRSKAGLKGWRALQNG